MEKGQTLVIWFKNGNTAFFQKVSDVESGIEEVGCETVTFKYFGQSTQVERQAIFNLENIAGFALD